MNPILCPGSTTSTDPTRPAERGEAGNGPCRGLTLILPAYNEAAAIAHTIRAAVTALDQLAIDYEVLVVDDGSTDETAAIAAAEGRLQSRVRVVSLGRNAGYGAALRRGFREAHFDRVAFTDADGQFDLRELSRLLPSAKDFDLVCGFRIDRQDHWSRKVYSRGFNLLVRALLGTRIRDCDCALKILRRDQMLALGLESDDFFINAELLSRSRLAGHTVTEVGVSHLPRVRGESKVSILHVFPVFAALVRFWWSKVLFSAPDSKIKIPVKSGARWAAGSVLALVSALMLVPNLSYPLIDPDESRYAEVSREMLESGDYVVPTRFGRPYLDKPPLLYWLTAASFRGFGVSESAARLVPALAAMLTVIATYALGARLLGYAGAWLGGLSMLSCFGFLISGRFVFIDTLLMLFTTVCLLTGSLAGRGTRFNVWWWIASSVACALGVLAKGPIAIVICLPPLVTHRWLTCRRGAPFRYWALYAAVGAAVTLPWFLLVNARQPGFLLDFLWRHHVSRFVSGLSHTEPWWYYVPMLLIGMLPCSMLFPAMIAFLADRGPSTRPWRTWDVGFLLISAAWTFLFFSGSSCKLPPYLLPCVPPLCLVIGRALESILSGTVEAPFLRFVRQRSPQHLILFLLAAAVVCGGIDVFLLDGIFAGRATHWMFLIGGGIVVGLASLVGLFRRAGLPWAATGAMAIVSMGFAMQDFYPGIATMRSKVNPVVDLCRSEIDRSTPIVCFSLAHEADSLVFHLGTRSVRSYDTDQLQEALQALLQSPEIIVVANENSVDYLRLHLPIELKLSELGRYQHIFVGVCTPDSRVAARK